MEWKETRIVPKIGTTHVKESYEKYEDMCWKCTKNISCERCNVSIPIVTDEYEIKEVTMRQDTICGIPVGHPYEVKR